MTPVRNGRLIFNEIAQGMTTVYDDKQTLDIDNVPLNGSILVKTLLLSVDPYMRGKMRNCKIQYYSEPYILGEPIYGLGIGKVLRSEHAEYKPGDYVYGMINFEEYVIPKRIINKVTLRPVIARLSESSWDDGEDGILWVEGVLAGKEGMSYRCMGEVAFVIQLAKLDGMKVITSAGTDDKVKECKEVGADVAFNYKTIDTSEILRQGGPLNVYWDNVGGPTLDTALGATAHHARIIVCGMVSEYNNQDGTHLKNLWAIYGRSLHIHGFLAFDLAPKWDAAFWKEVPPLVASGKLRHREDITKGLENSGEAILEVQKGINFGKKIILVAEE
uniref:Enoyl reductase (ER) domain-containing protein n=1 Tax=Moniliophthora roreri TaxID=221103 RepID=A0A0W0F3W5_MONRR